MLKLVLTQGLPASGKTTWAKQFVTENQDWIRVSKDDIREGLGEGWKWSHEAEARDVIPERDRQVTQALKNNWNVIVDDTNFSRQHKVRLETLARENHAEVEWKRFDTPVADCIERDAGRPKPVGSKVIWDMYHKYVSNDSRFPVSSNFTPPAPDLVVPDDSLMKAVICDLDGTLALFEHHRGPYDASRCDEDRVNPVVNRLIRTYSTLLHYQIIYLSGREDKFRIPTETFLTQNRCPAGPLWMRKSGDHRKDFIVKRELFDANVRGKYNIELVLDDRSQVIKMWREELGLVCFQVAPGDF